MRVAVDALLASPRNGGLGAYVTQIISGLGNVSGVETLAIAPRQSLYPEPEIASDRVVVERIVLPPACPSTTYGLRSYWEQRVLPQVLEALKPDVFLGPAFMVPVKWPGLKVATVHDLAFERSPQYNSRASRNYYRAWAKTCAQAATAIITNSQFTAQELSSAWHLRDRVYVVPLAPSLDSAPPAKGEAASVVSRELEIREPYILFVGNDLPRKNLARLLQAYDRHDEVRNGFKLVIVAEPTEGMMRLIDEHNLSSRIVVTGYSRPELLPHIYAASEMLVYPSMYEGFGLPPLEAMMCGTPVIASTGGAIPEVVDGAALLVDPEDVQELAGAMRRLLGDSGLQARLRQSGFEHVRRFTWSDVTKNTLRVLMEVVSGSGATELRARLAASKPPSASGVNAT